MLEQPKNFRQIGKYKPVFVTSKTCNRSVSPLNNASALSKRTYSYINLHKKGISAKATDVSQLQQVQTHQTLTQLSFQKLNSGQKYRSPNSKFIQNSSQKTSNSKGNQSNQRFKDIVKQHNQSAFSCFTLEQLQSGNNTNSKQQQNLFNFNIPRKQVDSKNIGTNRLMQYNSNKKPSEYSISFRDLIQRIPNREDSLSPWKGNPSALIVESAQTNFQDRKKNYQNKENERSTRVRTPKSYMNSQRQNTERNSSLPKLKNQLIGLKGQNSIRNLETMRRVNSSQSSKTFFQPLAMKRQTSHLQKIEQSRLSETNSSEESEKGEDVVNQSTHNSELDMNPHL